WEYHNWRSDIFSSAEECLLSGWDENFEDYAIESEEFLRIVIKTLKNARNRYFKEADVLISLFLPSVGHEMSKTAAVKINPFGVAEQYLNDLQRLYGV
ncbi:MAG: hypothetical protein JWQ08_2331, partial [Deinococcus sp.]|nr:hypothetical protein [Deinococcus sp.]